jgi:menaquinone-dependent protoporphyrinogen oxidase
VVLAIVTIPRTSNFLSASNCVPVNPVNKKILVVYDSKYGSTSTIAAQIGNTLCEKGAEVDMLFVEKVTSIEKYDAIIVGSPIYWGVWLPGAKSFIEKHKKRLKKIPVAFFILCNALREGHDTKAARAKVRTLHFNPLVDELQKNSPVKEPGMFGGKVDYKDLHIYERFVLSISGYEENDSRDFQKVQNWTNKIAPHLLN